MTMNVESEHDADGGGEPTPPRQSPYLDPYRSAVDSHGASFEATLWANRQWQFERFRIFVELLDMSGLSVLDAGSGQGDLAEYLRKRRVKYERYIGLDAMPEMVEMSRARKLARAEFHTCDFVAEADSFTRFGEPKSAPPEERRVDVIVISGALNTLRQDAAMRVLDRAWRDCGVALLFNFLSDRRNPRKLPDNTGPAHRFNTIELTDWALSRTTCVAMRHDYLPYGHDATILMGKESG
ncbi:MAG: class I SAM-dependent methyltransferase [Phycisphaeraceae bacterium]|nr:MAG: class I SAM-dependent methyltransferase [Phycisphaeraceae bacterium]